MTYTPGPYESRLLADIDDAEHTVDRLLAVRPGTRSTRADHPAAPTYADTIEATERIGADRARVARTRTNDRAGLLARYLGA